MPKVKTKTTTRVRKTAIKSPAKVTSLGQLDFISNLLVECWQLGTSYFLPIVFLVALFYAYCHYFFNWLTGWLTVPVSTGSDFLTGTTTLALIICVVAFLTGLLIVVSLFGALIRAMAEKKPYWPSMLTFPWGRTFNLVTYGLMIFFVLIIPALVMTSIGSSIDGTISQLGNFLVYGWWSYPNVGSEAIILALATLICGLILIDICVRSFLAPVLMIKDGLGINAATVKARLMSRGNRIILFGIFILMWIIFSCIALTVLVLSGSSSLINASTSAVIALFCITAGYLGVAITRVLKKPAAMQLPTDSMFAKTVLWVFLLPVIGCWLAFAFLHRSASDIEAVADKSSGVVFAAVPATDNAYNDLFKNYPRVGKQIFNAAANQSTFLGVPNYAVNSYAMGKTWPQADIDKLLTKGLTQLALYDLAKSRHYFQVPEGQFSAPGYEPSYNYVLGIARLAAIRGENALRQGNIAQAKDEALGLIKFSRLLSGSATVSYDSYQKSKSIAVDLGWPLLNRVIDTGSLNAEELSALSASLASPGSNFTAAVQGQYLLSKSLVRQVSDIYREQEYFIQYACYCASALGQMTRYITNLSKLPSVHFYTFSPDAIESYYNFDGSLGAYFKRNRFCDSYLAQLVSGAVRTLDSRSADERAERATIIRVAALRYQLATKQLPATLADLVPAYLSAIPADPYDLKPFKYNHTSGLVYGIGKNLRDNKGMGDDAGLRIETKLKPKVTK